MPVLIEQSENITYQGQLQSKRRKQGHIQCSRSSSSWAHPATDTNSNSNYKHLSATNQKPLWWFTTRAEVEPGYDNAASDL